ncbi:hypothetical protein ACWT_3811 [Actinoplanes sp. SE50]|uniref:DUF6209 family protein n=1 Tax=unclassified Actinoplanes TaxID=2626549 RepID=UPI00023ECCCA|nr:MULTISPECIES: DUF6209 family protein [unclassified Actinoplanes]AEV84834.1 hypothetical protein ACPL_3939 [Actinoplanes sp. SE50/110]ATO83226.1 hypothetical protein ACWT_3811 [Actinoplanes sp. SE50]SLM00633.1 putative carbohydrate-binding protein [Actinoplanes sp. SE50/110]
MPRTIAVIILASAATLAALAGPAQASTAVPSTAVPSTAAPVIHFAADGTDRVDGAIEAGRPVIVDYDLSRLPECRNQYAGGDAWSIGVYYRVDGGPIQTRPVTRLDQNRHNVTAPAGIDLPPGGHDLELWFHAGDRAGCSEYDSRSGANYHYPIGQPAVVTFRADWSETVTGSIEAGHRLALRYDTARLPECRDQAWRIDVFRRFDGGPAQSETLTTGDGSQVPGSIDIPAGSHQVEIWFQVTADQGGCTAYDSDFGANYVYAVA